MKTKRIKFSGSLTEEEKKIVDKAKKPYSYGKYIVRKAIQDLENFLPEDYFKPNKPKEETK